MRWLLALPCVLLLAGVAPGQAPKKPAADPAAELFGPDKLWTVHLKLTAAAWDKMQPKRGGMGFGGPGGGFGKKDGKKDGPPKGGPGGAGQPGQPGKGGPGGGGPGGGVPGKFGFGF